MYALVLKMHDLGDDFISNKFLDDNIVGSRTMKVDALSSRKGELFTRIGYWHQKLEAIISVTHYIERPENKALNLDMIANIAYLLNVMVFIPVLILPIIKEIHFLHIVIPALMKNSKPS